MKNLPCVTAIPTNRIDDFWKGYVAIEKSVSEHLAEQLMPAHSEKYTEAKLIYKESDFLIRLILL